MATHSFEMVGGHPVLDFLNTISDWTLASPKDYLPDYLEALRFGEVAGVLSHGEGRRLAKVAPRREMERLRALRGALARLAKALASGSSPLPADLAAAAASEIEALRVTVLRVHEGALTGRVDPDRAGVGLLRLRLATLAVELLSSSEDMQKLKTCPSCGWFFLDVSKNQSRRWCSMQTCGAVVKSRRYYWRSKKET